jgi:hypothetical protein
MNRRCREAAVLGQLSGGEQQQQQQVLSAAVCSCLAVPIKAQMVLQMISRSRSWQGFGAAIP